jgi:imidazolonepropionase-like amidohydrolase
MTPTYRLSAGALAIAAALAVSASADAPHIYAIRGAKIVPVSGAEIASGTIVIRDGLIEAVGASIQPPAEAHVVDGSGMTVYPGLIDMANSAGSSLQVNRQAPANLRTTEETERWKRSVILTPAVNAADHLREAPELTRLASAGITNVLSIPPGAIVRGRSALVNVVPPVDEPAIGNVGDYRIGVQVVKTPVALHIDPSSNVGGGYPVSVPGVLSFLKQTFLDAQRQQLVAQKAAKNPSMRTVHDPALEALQPALAGQLPVAFEANTAREITRLLEMAREFKLTPMITGGQEADQVADELKARNVSVIYNVNYPTRSRALPPDAEESLSTLRERANAPRVPGALQKAGVTFAFSGTGINQPRDFVRNVGRAVREGLPADAALRALTLNAAKIAGADTRLGSIEKGKLANLIVTQGDLFDERMQIKHVFVEGRMVPVEEAPAPQRGGRGRGGN